MSFRPLRMMAHCISKSRQLLPVQSLCRSVPPTLKEGFASLSALTRINCINLCAIYDKRPLPKRFFNTKNKLPYKIMPCVNYKKADDKLSFWRNNTLFCDYLPLWKSSHSSSNRSNDQKYENKKDKTNYKKSLLPLFLLSTSKDDDSFNRRFIENFVLISSVFAIFTMLACYFPLGVSFISIFLSIAFFSYVLTELN